MLPQEVADLLEIVEIKALCRRAGISQVDAGPKGATIAFRHAKFSNPSGLVRFIQTEKPGTIKVGADQRLTIRADWGDDAERRLKGARGLVRKLAELAGDAAAKAA